MTNSGFPAETATEDTLVYFNNYYSNNNTVSYLPIDVDAVIGYFLNRGFEKVAAVNTAGVLLEQSKRDSVPVFKLIDTLKGINDVQLSNIVAQIINANRRKTSSVGYRQQSENLLFDQRNIIV